MEGAGRVEAVQGGGGHAAGGRKTCGGFATASECVGSTRVATPVQNARVESRRRDKRRTNRRLITIDTT